MNAFVLLTALAVSGNFNTDDFHYMKDQQVVALPLTNKLYFETDQNNADDLYETLKPKDLERRFKGLVLTFENKEEALKALNKISQDQIYNGQAHPVVKYNTIEVAVLDYLIVELHPTVKKEDYLNRLNSVADAKFELVDVSIGPLPRKPFKLIKVKDIKNPTNILALVDLVTRDTFWVKSAKPRFLPLYDYVTASLSVETPSQTDLGHRRVAKLVIDVYDPKIVVRTDLLPMMGQGNFRPFPYTGDVWLDTEPSKITETKDGDKRTITVEYPFKYLQLGTFAFEPVKVPYEQDGILRETSSKTSTFVISSVINDTDIEDVQPVLNDCKMSTQTAWVSPKFPGAQNDMGLMMILALVGVFGTAFIGAAVIPWLTNERKPKIISVWDEMKDVVLPKNIARPDLPETPWEEWYADAANAVDNVLIEEFGTSLHSLVSEDCNDNFKRLLAEFNNLYIPNEKHNAGNLNACILKFYKDRKYD